jgi:hypothetical protein
MCAASVYPEPGSNSHVNGIYICIFLCSYISFLTKVYLALFLRFRVYFFLGSFTTALLVSQSLLFTFQCAFFILNSNLFSSGTCIILLLLKSYVNTFFKLFLILLCLFISLKKCKIIN